MFDFEIQHRPGKQHGNADGMSRIPCKQCGITDIYNEVMAVKKVKNKEEINDENECETENKTEDVYNESWMKTWSSQEIIKMQCDDTIIGKIIELLKKYSHQPNWQTLSIESHHVKIYWSQWDQLKLINGILYRQWHDPVIKQCKFQLILPECLRNEVLDELHSNKTGGHLGRNKMYGKVQHRFYWVGWRQDVEQFCSSCEMCHSRKPPQRKKRSSLQSYTVGMPLERIGIDILGPLPRTYKRNKYILVVSDYFSKWVEAYPMRNIEAKTVAQKLFENFITRFGAPKILHSDQGRQFESEYFLVFIKPERPHFTPAVMVWLKGLIVRWNICLACSLKTISKLTPNMMMFGHEIN
jgi:hypothetical protein